MCSVGSPESAKPSALPVRNAVGVGAQDPVGRDLGGPFWRVLRAETSCNLHWGQARVDHCHTDLDDASRFLERIGTAPA